MKQGNWPLIAYTVIVVSGLLLALLLALAPPSPAPPTPTPTKPPQNTPTVEVLTPTSKDTATVIPSIGTHTPTAQATATATSTPTVVPQVVLSPTPACRTGVITAHAAIEQVLANKPERRCEGCTYYASVMCQDIGRDLTLQIGILQIPVRVADCAAWTVGPWPQKSGRDWIGELDIRAWPEGAPITPLEATLCD